MGKLGWDSVVTYTNYFNFNMAARSHNLPFKGRKGIKIF